jgi:hypothetical protein
MPECWTCPSANQLMNMDEKLLSSNKEILKPLKLT